MIRYSTRDKARYGEGGEREEGTQGARWEWIRNRSSCGTQIRVHTEKAKDARENQREREVTEIRHLLRHLPPLQARRTPTLAD